MHEDQIRLRVPARSEYAKTVRLTAASLASRMGWSYDAVDDIRMAAEEAFIYAVDTVSDDDSVEFTFLVGEARSQLTSDERIDLRARGVALSRRLRKRG